MRRRDLYLYEVIDIVGPGSVRVHGAPVEGPGAGHAGDGQAPGLVLHLRVRRRAVGRRSINIWDVGTEGWTGWAQERRPPEPEAAQGVLLAIGGTRPYKWRTGGFDRLCGGVPGSPNTAEIVARGVKGTLFVNEILSVRAGYRARVPGRGGRGAGAADARVRPRADRHLRGDVDNPHEVVMVWATDIPAQMKWHANRDTTRGLSTEGEADDRIVAWERGRREYTIGGATHIMTPLPRTVYGPDDWEDATTASSGSATVKAGERLAAARSSTRSRAAGEGGARTRCSDRAAAHACATSPRSIGGCRRPRGQTKE